MRLRHVLRAVQQNNMGGPLVQNPHLNSCCRRCASNQLRRERNSGGGTVSVSKGLPMLTAWLVLSKATDRIGTPAALCMFDPPGIPHADGPQEECACPCSNERIDSQIRAIWIDLQSALGQRVRSSNCSLYRFSAIETHLQN